VEHRGARTLGARRPSLVTRRKLLATAAGAAALAAVGAPRGAVVQTPKRGGTLTIRAWDPPHFDHSLVHAYRTHVAISFTHSRLLRHRAGPAVKPGSLTLEGDLAESWTQPSDTTYVFRPRRGVRFHPKPPVNGRELTADDVKFTFERMLTETGSHASMYRSIAKIEALDR
jgi:peptide/nickel transport system substrate-binding protein